jgi:acyl dehydratase
MADLLFYDDLSVGDRWVSERRQVTEADVAQFADLTGDYDPLHIDEEFARQTPFRQPIAHGLLGLSLVAGIGSESPNVETVAFLGVSDWVFRKPIFFDDTLHVVTMIKELQPNGKRRGHVTWHRQLVNQDDEMVQEGVLLSLVACKSASLHRQIRSTTDLAATGQ